MSGWMCDNRGTWGASAAGRVSPVMLAIWVILAMSMLFGAGAVSAQPALTPLPIRFVIGGLVMLGGMEDDYAVAVATPKPTAGWFRREFCLREGLYDNTLTLNPYQSAVTIGALTSSSSIRCSSRPNVPRFMLHDVAGQLVHWLGWRHFRYIRHQQYEGVVQRETDGFRSWSSASDAAPDKAFRRVLCAQTDQVDVTGQGLAALQSNAFGLVVCAGEGAVQAADRLRRCCRCLCRRPRHSAAGRRGRR